MKKKLTNNLGMKLAALAIAVVLWLIIHSVADPVTTRPFSAKVEIRNDDILQQQDENYIYTKVSGDTATFSVEGPSSLVERLSASDFYVYADMKKLSKVNSVPVEIIPKRYTGDITVLPHANTLQVELDEVIEKTMSVAVEAKGEPADGYALGTMTSEPNLVKVKGPKKILDNADVLAVSVNVNGQTKNVTSQEIPRLYDKNGDEITDEAVSIGVTSVKVTIEVWPTREFAVQLQIDATAADGYGIVGTPVFTPEVIHIAGKAEDLAELEDKYNFIDDGVITYPVSGEDLQNLTANKEGSVLLNDYLDTAKYKIVEKNVREQGITYQISVEEKRAAALTVPTDKIKFTGMKDNFTYRFKDEEKVELSITGISSELNKVKPSDDSTYEIFLDVSQCDGPGEYSVPVEGKFAGAGVTLAGEQYISIIVESTGEADSDSETGQS